MERDGWFDGQGLELHRDGFLEGHAGWQRYLADGRVTAAEILEQEGAILELLEKVEPKLSDELHREFTRIFLEYEVLVNMALLHEPSVVEDAAYRPLGAAP